MSTSSSESALPRLIAKMNHAGVEKTTVGVVVPTGYSFNLDGTAIYLTMASIFIADALDKPLSVGEQVSLLLFMVIASKGAAGVTGAGLATLAGGLSSHRPELLDGVGLILKVVTGVNIFRLLKYLGREFLLIVSTSSSESALPRLIAKMNHAGVEKTTVGVVVPTGYSFDLDGTAIYLTMASIFIADALDKPLSIGEQFSLLLFMIIASKGAAGVTGAGLATLAGGLSSHRPELLDGVGLIVGIDRFMSEARAVTNFTGNAVATLLVGTWTKEVDMSQVREVLAGRVPFDEASLGADDHGAPAASGTSITEGIASISAADRAELAGKR